VSSEVRGVARAQTPARVLDLSLKGVLLVLETPLDVGAIHDFALDVQGQTLWVQGEVRRSQKRERGGFEVGVEFVGIDPHDERRLREYLQTV
jgi:c-di-GMP-binding flagellar brake protein YcgR